MAVTHYWTYLIASLLLAASQCQDFDQYEVKANQSLSIGLNISIPTSSSAITQLNVKYQCLSHACISIPKIQVIKHNLTQQSRHERNQYLFQWSACDLQYNENLTLDVFNPGNESLTIQVSVEAHQISPYSFKCLKSSIKPQNRQHHGVAQDQQGNLWVFGGISNGEVLGDFWLLDSQRSNWEHLTQAGSDHQKLVLESVPSSRYGHTLETYHEYLILFGGKDSQGKLLNDLWVYSVQGKSWTQIKNQTSQYWPQEGLAFSGTSFLKNTGKLIFIGGKGIEQGKILILDVEQAIQTNHTSLFSIIEIGGDFSITGHTVIQISPILAFIFGGLLKNSVSNEISVLNFETNQFQVFNHKSLPGFQANPTARQFASAIYTGGGQIILQGGLDGKNQSLSDLWLIRLDLQNGLYEAQQIVQSTIESQYQYDRNYGHSFLVTYQQNELLLIGNTELVTVDQKSPIPCPQGSVNINETCHQCQQNQYWKDTPSIPACLSCPYGLVQSHSRTSCQPCEEGTYYSNVTLTCQKCIGICQALLSNGYLQVPQNMSVIKSQNKPPITVNLALNRDNTEKILSMTFGAFILIGTLVILISHKISRLKTIETVICADQLSITSGTTQTYAGGIITLLYTLTIFTMASGIVMKYNYFNQRIENSHISSFDQVNDIQSSFSISLKLYVTQFSNLSFDLCSNVRERIISSDKFAKEQFTLTCNLQQNEEYARKQKAQSLIYDLIFDCEGCKIGESETALIKLEINDEIYSLNDLMLIHMYQWEYRSIWDKDIDEDTAELFYSSVSGFGNPNLDQSKHKARYFGGSEPTIINLLITKSHYASYIDYSERSGYRATYQSHQLGSTLSDRQIGSINNETQHFQLKNPDVNSNFAIIFAFHLSQNTLSTRVIQLKSIFESLAEIMGFLAGFSFISRFCKMILSNHKVWAAYDDLYAKLQERINKKREDAHLSLQQAIQNSPRKNSEAVISGREKLARERSLNANRSQGIMDPEFAGGIYDKRRLGMTQSERLSEDDFKFNVHNINFHNKL